MDREKVIKGLETCMHRIPGKYSCAECPYEIYGNNCEIQLAKDDLALLKEREGYVSVPFLWLVKFCTHIDFVEPLTDAEREAAWRQKLRQQFGINVSKKAVEFDGR